MWPLKGGSVLQAHKINKENQLGGAVDGNFDVATRGMSVVSSKTLSRPISRKGAMVWCAFLGAFGAHRFYLGEKGLGWLYLGFSWTLIPLVAAFLDFALLAMQDDEDFAEERREIPLLKPPRYERPAVLGTGSLRAASASHFRVGEAIEERKRGGR